MIGVLIIFGLLVLNGFFAMCEIALVASRKSILENHAINGSRGATTALKLLKEPKKFLSTVQIGITLVGIIAGAYGAEAFTENVQPFFARFEIIQSYSEEISFTSIVIIITYFSLIIGELVPKSIALNNPENITIALSPVMNVLTLIAYPIVLFLSFSTKILLKVLFIKERNDISVTEEELKYMIDTSSRHGVIEKEEGEIMQGVFRFADRKAKEVMTKKSQIKWINIKLSKAEILADVFQSSTTKYPVCDGSLDKVIGVISVTDIIKSSKTDNGIDFRKYMVKPALFAENTSTLKILDAFRKNKIHMGIVVNEQGSAVGLITLHDLIENIIGDLPEWNDDAPKVINRPDGSVLLDADLKMKDVIKIFHIKGLPETYNNMSLAEFAVHQLESTPRTGSSFVFDNHKFEIVDIDGTRIDKVIINKIV